MRHAIVVSVMLAAVSCVWADEEKIAIDQLPKAVLESVKKRFPKAEITGAVKETEDKKISFEVALKSEGQSIELDLLEDGTITGMDKEIAFKDLPKAVSETIADKYPKAKLKKAAETYDIKDGKETLTSYEVTLESDGKEVEIEILPDGKLKPMEKK